MALFRGQSSSVAAALSPGGGGPPPAGLLFDANFQTGTYEVAGSPATVADILSENTNWGSWNPATDIDSNGIVFDPGVGPVLAAAFFTTASTAGITLTGAITLGAQTDSGVLWEMNDDPTYTAENAGEIQTDALTIVDYVGSDTASGPGSGTFNYALNMAPDRIAMSVNGSGVLARDVPAVTFTLLGLYPASESVAYLVSIAGRALVAESELPTLSTP
jgi:hypothetical protein